METKRSAAVTVASLAAASVVSLFVFQSETAFSIDPPAHDPGVRGGNAGAGNPVAGLSTTGAAFFQRGKEEFLAAEVPDEGLGPRMNLDSCAGCHSQPAV